MRNRSGRTRAALVAVVMATLGGCASAPEPMQGDFAIVDVNVVPMTVEAMQPHRTVVVKDGRIVAIEATGARPLAPNVRRVDGAGRWLIPGLADMHVHVGSDDDLLLYVANGVTVVRNMWGDAETLNRRARVAACTLLGPRIVTAGPLMDGDPPVWSQSLVVHDAAEACARMAEQQQQGYDFLKIYNNISSATFDGIVACSRATGFPFAGHVPDRVGMTRMVEGGARSIEHLTGYDDADRRPGGPYRPRADYANPRSRISDRVALAARVGRGELAWSDVFDPQRRDELARLAAQHRVWSVPTLAVNVPISTPRPLVATELKRPEMRYVDPMLLAAWNPDNDFRRKSVTDEELRLLSSYFDENLARVRALRRADAPLLVGTDAPNPFVVHGFAVHEELQLLVRAGLTPYEALSAATRRPAEFLGEEGRFGTVVVGGRADLVLLDADPLADVGATRRIAGVSLAGRWLPPSELQTMLDRVAGSFATPDDWFEGVAPLPDGARGTPMRLRMAGVETGAERFAELSGEDGGLRVLAQASGRDGSRYVATIELRTAVGGSPGSLDYRRVQAGTTTTARLHREGAEMILEGRAGDAAPVAGREPVGDAVAVGCDLAACLVPLLPSLRALAPGERRRVVMLALDVFPQLGLAREEWTLMRDADTARAGARIEVHRGKSTRGMRVRWDERGLVAVVSDGDLGDLETARTDER